jgi:hypothetical protein
MAYQRDKKISSVANDVLDRNLLRLRIEREA